MSQMSTPNFCASQVSRDGRGLWLSSYKDVPMYRRSAVLPSMFPSGKNYKDLVDSNHKMEMGDDIDKGDCGNSEDGSQAAENPVADKFIEEVSDLPLEHCMRIVPHDQNAGAFFIAVLQKVSPLPAIPISEKTKNEIDKQHGQPENQDIEGSKVLQVDSLENTQDEALEEANVIDNKPNTEDLEASPSGACLEGDSEEVQKPLEKESVAKMTSGKRKLQIQGKWRGVDPVFFF